jgi:hypothetical protein
MALCSFRREARALAAGLRSHARWRNTGSLSPLLRQCLPWRCNSKSIASSWALKFLILAVIRICRGRQIGFCAVLLSRALSLLLRKKSQDLLFLFPMSPTHWVSRVMLAPRRKSAPTDFISVCINRIRKIYEVRNGHVFCQGCALLESDPL